MLTYAYVSIRQHTSAYVSQHTSAYVSIRQHASAYTRMRQHTSAGSFRYLTAPSQGLVLRNLNVALHVYACIYLYSHTWVHIYTCVCVCVCVRERERERENVLLAQYTDGHTHTHIQTHKPRSRMTSPEHPSNGNQSRPPSSKIFLALQVYAKLFFLRMCAKCVCVCVVGTAYL